MSPDKSTFNFPPIPGTHAAGQQTVQDGQRGPRCPRLSHLPRTEPSRYQGTAVSLISIA